MRTLIDEVVILKDITHLWLTDVCVWLWEYLSIDVSNHCWAIFYVSFNAVVSALSFGMTVASQPLGFTILIKTLINDLWTVFMNSEHMHWGRYSACALCVSIIRNQVLKNDNFPDSLPSWFLGSFFPFFPFFQ